MALAVSSYAIANLLWLKNPTSAPELPRKWVVAHAYAATQPPPAIWKKYLAEIARLEEAGTVTTDEYLLLRHSFSAKVALMDLTEGSEDAFSEGSINDILEVARENVRSDLKQEVDKQRRQLVRTEEELRTAEAASLAQRQMLRGRAGTVARFVRNSIFVLLAVVLIFGVLLTFPWQFPSLQSSWRTYLAPFGLITLGIFTVGNLICGTNVKGLADTLERRIAVGVADAFFSFSGIDPTSPLIESSRPENSEF